MSSSIHHEKWLLASGIIVFIASLSFATYFYTRWKNKGIIHLPIPDCDLRQTPCTTSLKSGEQITLRVKPTYMPVLTSVQLDVKTKNIPAKKVCIHFKGVEMDMGEFRYTLTPQRENTYSASTILPTCFQQNMVWYAVVHIHTAHQHYSAPFILINQKPLPHMPELS